MSPTDKQAIIRSYAIWKDRGADSMLIGILNALASINLLGILDNKGNLIDIIDSVIV